ncbi:glycosyltransferase [Marinobacter sp. RI1]|uniref:glycosyltransferase n=1 Tax=Marinobacter sp. RI1 TaxID=3158171 RepID=UPI0034E8B236
MHRLTPEKWIILAGGFGLPDRTASATRAIGLAKLAEYSGYRVLILGKFVSAPRTKYDQYEIVVNGVKARDIRRPFLDSSECDYVVDGASVEDVAKYIGPEKVALVLLYNYPSRGLMSVMRRCAKINAPVALDLTEWYGWEGAKIVRNIIRVVDTEFRMRVLSKYVGNVICTSSFLARKILSRNMMILPFVVDKDEWKWSQAMSSAELDPEARTFVYSGSPGLRMHKDLLPQIVQAFSLLPLDGCKFVLDIVGIDKETYLSEVPRHVITLQLLGNRVRFHGRVSHETALRKLVNSHYSIFVRKPNRVSNSGFPTKYMEATTLGVPVISNITSDIGNYLFHKRNGIVVEGFDSKSILKALKLAVEMDAGDYMRMREEQLSNNPFEKQNWIDLFRSFMGRLQ